jgi:hypothetical protein
MHLSVFNIKNIKTSGCHHSCLFLTSNYARKIRQFYKSREGAV